MKLILCLLIVSLTGCVPIRHGDKTYYIIVGAGFVRVSQTNQVTVVKADALGVFNGDGQTTIGLGTVYSARVPTNANVRLEVTK